MGMFVIKIMLVERIFIFALVGAVQVQVEFEIQVVVGVQIVIFVDIAYAVCFSLLTGVSRNIS